MDSPIVEVTGHLDLSSQYANPFFGRAIVRAAQGGFQWESQRTFRGRRSGVSWSDFDTFARTGEILNLAWKKVDPDGSVAGWAQAEFKGSTSDLKKLEGARLELLQDLAGTHHHPLAGLLEEVGRALGPSSDVGESTNT